VKKTNLEHYDKGCEKKPYFSRLYLIFQKWTFINVQNSFPFLLLGKNIAKSLWTKGCNHLVTIYAVVTEIIIEMMMSYMVTNI
jgi:hypothetical protein